MTGLSFADMASDAQPANDRHVGMMETLPPSRKRCGVLSAKPTGVENQSYRLSDVVGLKIRWASRSKTVNKSRESRNASTVPHKAKWQPGPKH